MRAGRVRVAVLLLGVVTLGSVAGACATSSEGDEKSPPAVTRSTGDLSAMSPSAGELTASPTPVMTPPADCPPPPPARDVEFDQELHDELVAMLERDQAGRTGGVDDEGDAARTERLREILAEHGWPGFDLVGEDGEDAAWAVAQHSDLDRDFQLCALSLLAAAVAAGQGSPGNLAYLHDRVAVSGGLPQRYGTQVGCGPDGPEPATPLEDEAAVDEARAAMDLPPYADYLAEMEAVCAEVE